MNPSLKGAREQLIRQLVYFDEDKTSFLDTYCPRPGLDRSRLEATLLAYTAALERCLREFGEESLNSEAFIGSRIRVAYPEEGEQDSYTLVYPSRADPNQGKISFLSPVGRRLLLGKPDTACTLDTPAGKLDLHIVDVRYVNQGELH